MWKSRFLSSYFYLLSSSVLLFKCFIDLCLTTVFATASLLHSMRYADRYDLTTRRIKILNLNSLELRHLLWPPYILRQAIYIFILWFLLSFFFFPRLISAVGDWMVYHTSTHRVALRCKFRMQIWNVLRAAHWKYSTQKIAKSRHLDTIHPQLCRAISSQLRHVSTIEKNLLNSDISPTCSHTIIRWTSPD